MVFMFKKTNSFFSSPSLKKVIRYMFHGKKLLSFSLSHGLRNIICNLSFKGKLCYRQQKYYFDFKIKRFFLCIQHICTCIISMVASISLLFISEKKIKEMQMNQIICIVNVENNIISTYIFIICTSYQVD